jgi:hypothetical protein
MNTIELLKHNARAGIRFPYPADPESLAQLKQLLVTRIRHGLVLFGGCVTWDRGEALFLTARRIAGTVWLQLQTRKEVESA